MVETTAQIETHIEMAREDLGANLGVLEQKVKSVTDWREYFQSNPLPIVGAVFAGGLVLAMTTVGRSTRRRAAHAAPAAPRRMGPHTQEVVGMLDTFKGALIGMAATRVKDLVADALPGFREEFDRRQQSGAASGPTSTR